MSGRAVTTCANSIARHTQAQAQAQRHVQACSSPPRQASKSCSVSNWRQCSNTLRNLMIVSQPSATGERRSLAAGKIAQFANQRTPDTSSPSTYTTATIQMRQQPQPLPQPQVQKGGVIGAQFGQNGLQEPAAEQEHTTAKASTAAQVAASITERHSLTHVAARHPLHGPTHAVVLNTGSNPSSWSLGRLAT